MEKNGTQKSSSTLVTVIGIVVLLVVAYVIMNAMTTTNGAKPITNQPTTTIEYTSNQTNPSSTVGANTLAPSGTSSASTTDSDSATAFTIKVANLPSPQQTMLRSAGFNGDVIIITNKMKACAESSLGADRIAAVSRGEKPTVIEAAKLMICYNES